MLILQTFDNSRISALLLLLCERDCDEIISAAVAVSRIGQHSSVISAVIYFHPLKRPTGWSHKAAYLPWLLQPENLSRTFRGYPYISGSSFQCPFGHSSIQYAHKEQICFDLDDCHIFDPNSEKERIDHSQELVMSLGAICILDFYDVSYSFTVSRWRATYYGIAFTMQKESRMRRFHSAKLITRNWTPQPYLVASFSSICWRCNKLELERTETMNSFSHPRRPLFYIERSFNILL